MATGSLGLPKRRNRNVPETRKKHGYRVSWPDQQGINPAWRTSTGGFKPCRAVGRYRYSSGRRPSPSSWPRLPNRTNTPAAGPPSSAAGRKETSPTL